MRDYKLNLCLSKFTIFLGQLYSLVSCRILCYGGRLYLIVFTSISQLKVGAPVILSANICPKLATPALSAVSSTSASSVSSAPFVSPLSVGTVSSSSSTSASSVSSASVVGRPAGTILNIEPSSS